MVDFVTKLNNAYYNRKSEHAEHAKVRGDKKSKFQTANFLAWDGEGLQLEDTQVYGLMANSKGDYIIDITGLSTEKCLDFLTSDKYPKNTIHVCFGASYDVNMIMRDIPENLLRELHKGNRFVKWSTSKSSYELEYRPRKSFTIRKFRTEVRNGKTYNCYDHKKKKFVFERVVTLWDVFGFFQSKFTKVLKEWTRGTIYEDTYKSVISDIEMGKQKRGQFSQEETESFVLPYCLKECEALRDIMHILHGYLQDSNLTLSRWDGSGAIAASLLKREGIKKHIRTGLKLEIEPYPQHVIDAAEYAYFGGWIEGYYIGHIDMPIYHYDLISAYPSETVELDSLTMGHWQTIKIGNMLPIGELKELINSFPSFWIANVEWNNGPLYGPGPFSWRNKLGTVTRPIQGRGWQWSPEITAVIELFPRLNLKIGDIHFFVPDKNNIKPFLFMKEIFYLRKKLKAEGKHVQIVYKLALNSVYGKLAQSLGYDLERDLKPPFHCLIYAGLITSGTRAKILRAVMQSPLSIISIATDGIYSMKPLDLDIGENLGQWEYTQHESITLVQPGFYWFSTNGKESHYYRGFNEGCITREQVIQAYRDNVQSISVSTTRFITLGATIGLNNFNHWRTWRTQDRILDLLMINSSKRTWKGEIFPGYQNIKMTRNRIFDPNVFIQNPKMLDSKKYEFAWDDTRESGKWDGQSERVIVEEMFNMELSPM